MSKCICGCTITIEDAFVLDCKHDLCQDCSRVPSISTQCPACRVTAALAKTPIDSEDLTRHLETVYKRHKELVMEKQQALRGERRTREALERVKSARDNLEARSQPSRPAAGSSADTLTPSKQRKRKRLDGGSRDSGGGPELPADELEAFICRASEGFANTTRSLHRLKENRDKELADLQSLCRQKDERIRDLETLRKKDVQALAANAKCVENLEASLAVQTSFNISWK
ncbi:hypothetical protein FA95DRAFT_1572274 [Auriscalpium vulgare]|uniref:Uncharacterized protein n=1 Tax=Auriscalpium vulgare TaxID=40419 RepID=A0ACB8RV65_9AGAM|nr:hypothetical protein FA95DRAFT_1572274 [Auriscalpium vulgare]